MKEWITPNEYKNRSGLTLHDVMKLIYQGTLPAVKVGKRFKINIVKADAELESMLHAPKDRPEKKVYEDIGKAANAAVDAEGGFMAALKALRKRPAKGASAECTG